MAQLILTAATTAASAIGKAGLGAVVARTVASTAASFAAASVTNLIFGPKRRQVEGPRIDSFSVQTSTEGAGILRVYGRTRVAGQLIWAARFKETVVEETQASGGKGGRPAVQTDVTSYRYSLSFAVGLSEGVIDRIGRVWADGKPFDLSRHNVRVYRGTEDQTPDDVIVAVEGAAPAFRGLAYVVFEDLPLQDFGNRIPQLSFEIEKALAPDDPAALENALTAVSVIPSSGEFVYGTTRVLRDTGDGATVPENAHNSDGSSDFTASLDALTAQAPNLSAAALIVSWFGDDLRAGVCQLRPGVETATKTTTPYDWSAGGVDRAGAHLISSVGGAPNYGGTPADRAVIEAIQDMKARGLEVMFHPFILMDVPPGNGLADPYGGAEQAAFPWRGRITVGANDKTASAATDVAAFFGTAQASDFAIIDGAVIYSGPNEWGFRRFILHNAFLCQLAGSVESFLLGSEMVALTTARDGANAYPAVAALTALTADVRAVLGGATKISYGADWSEYFGHQPTDGSGDVYFHLDDLWASSDIDFIGVDNYLPLADWRDGEAHLDHALSDSPYSLEYLQENLRAGERYDWFYASDADRDQQVRTDITDGQYSEPWVFRAKDFWSWWANPHHDRPGGVRSATPTAWTPQSKPIRFTEIGAPAVDKAANQPNVFYDPKSAESGAPFYSNGARDDLAQRRFLEAHLSYWTVATNNPVSSVYGASMVDAARAYVYAWDARPFPFFPSRDDVWGDTDNWSRGHWLNGRLGRAPLSLLVADLAASGGDINIVGGVDASQLDGLVTGYVVDRPMSARDMIEPLADVFQFDMVDTGAGVRFQPRRASATITLDADDLAVDSEGAAFSIAAAQRDDAPSSLRLGFLDEGADYAPAMVEALDPARVDVREAGLQTAIAIGVGAAEARARALLADAHVMRETAQFALPPSDLSLEPGDVIEADFGGAGRAWRITEITDGASRQIEAVRAASSVFDVRSDDTVFTRIDALPVYGAPVWALMDLPLFRDTDDAARPWFAADANPWPGGAALYRGDGSQLAATSPARAVMGAMVDAAPPAPSGRWLETSIRVRLNSGALASASESAVLAGANILFWRSAAGGYEVVQFREAVLETDGAWRLTGLLRGQAGTEAEAAAGADVGARVVVFTPALVQADAPLDLRGLALDWSAGPINQSPTEDSFTSKTVTVGPRGLAPLSPVHLKSAPDGAGGWRIDWIRRTRIGGDSWTGEDAPLGEAFERYRVTVLSGGQIVRTEETASPTFVYDASKVTADFGGPPGGAFEVRVAQISDLVGAGGQAAIIVA